ncbi:low molecular weight phosphatase family protein [Paenarthrobacter aromaticivorans]|uniref:protein-tyrosine-phosphatase n=1 Tax=Paenarthrobacter aromaticivorans TaxID=2849150 RepID=A0ABS6I9B4_9MICC|nr:low molecular weight phosphatase family protein [Paenarthrobacter sp. MMS21-TAE1-1]MBU8868301.1 low molecular weight phosphatase family protein [Paenarthrobacter sp. MMS21-TAE1-1]
MESLNPFRILTVCTGNICRSPVAERLLQAGLDQISGETFEVRSAGTRAMVGEPIQPLSADMIRMFGGNASDFKARQLTPVMLRQSDLILTMSSRHRPEVLQLDASLLKRTFTIREFARMLNVLMEDPAGESQGTIADWRQLPDRAAAVRHLSIPEDANDNDVVDPYRRGSDVYKQMENELAPAILSILRFARLNPGTGPKDALALGNDQAQ